jgi:hypothetical protein
MTFIPNLIGIGFPKAGTTFIARRLGTHPGIQLSSRKETHFWKKETLDFDAYRAFFASEDSADGGIFHEWTVSYIYSETALRNLASRVPEDTTFILAFRDPVASFFSNYNYRRMINHANLERTQPLSFFLTSQEHHDSYIWRYFFDIHFARFREFLPKHRVIVVDHAFMSVNLDQTFRGIYDILNLPYDDGHLLPGRENPSISPKSILFDRGLRKILRMLYDDPGSIYRADFQKKPLWISMIQKLNAEKYIYDEAVAKQLQELHAGHFADFRTMVENDENAILISD